jgi:CheY-like chemotaxis protein
VSTRYPRILLIEDDEPIRLFVSMALESRTVELVPCSTLQRAREALDAGPVDLVLLDLMLPDGSGLELLRDATRRGRAGPARWVVFSAALTAGAQEQLDALAIYRVLQKPVSLQKLLDCVDDALALLPDTATVATEDDDNDLGTMVADEQALALIDGTPQAEAAAVRDYFEGQLELFARVKAHAVGRMAKEIAEGDEAVAALDAQRLLRVAHSLRSLLRMLGRPTASELARSLEVAVQSRRQEAWATLWQVLRAALTKLISA